MSDADDPEGYLSPAEDTFSIFSDEQGKQKPFAQAGLGQSLPNKHPPPMISMRRMQHVGLYAEILGITKSPRIVRTKSRLVVE